jgi:hypothetical protein
MLGTHAAWLSGPHVVQLLCGHWLVSVDPILGELVGCEVAVGTVWSVHVAVDPPVLDEHLGLDQARRSSILAVEVHQPMPYFCVCSQVLRCGNSV